MASRFLENLLSAPYPTVFGNAMTMQEAQAANPSGAGSLDALRQQYEADQAALLAAANRVGAAQTAQAPARQSYMLPVERLMDIWSGRGPTQAAQISQEDARKAQEAAQKAADRSLNQYLLAQQAAASRPAAQQQAVNWGQMAQAAENRMISQAADAARNAIANENARMATLAAHPLLGGGIR